MLSWTQSASVICRAVCVFGVIGGRADASLLHEGQRRPLFWALYLHRPFGAPFGDLLSKPLAKGGLELGTLETSAVATALLVAIVFASSRIGTGREARIHSAWLSKRLVTRWIAKGGIVAMPALFCRTVDLIERPARAKILYKTSASRSRFPSSVSDIHKSS